MSGPKDHAPHQQEHPHQFSAPVLSQVRPPFEIPQLPRMSLPAHGGGWHSIGYTFAAMRRVGPWALWRAMRSKNACKTCALGMGGQQGGMRNERGAFPEVCKKSLQAMVADMQGALTPEFFAKWSVRQLQTLTPRELEAAGRISFPVWRRKGADFFEPLSWDEALTKIGAHWRGVDPRKAFFYASGRSSNEAGFLLQLLARAWGTAHVNNCSFYCHQASGVGLGESLGTGTATVSLEDVDSCDLFVLIGGNPASNHPRLMTSLMHLRRRGGHVLVINPMRERGLERFSIPSDVRSLFFGSEISSQWLQPVIGGDIAVLIGIARALLEEFPESIEHSWIAQNTEGWERAAACIRGTTWTEIEASSGVARAELKSAAALIAKSRKTIWGWTMGITHHTHGVENVQWIVNLALLRGMLGKPGAGLLPIRGHSNVQGIGSMGVTPQAKAETLAWFEKCGIKAPDWKGWDTMQCLEAAAEGEVKAALCLGGNLWGASPDAGHMRHAFSKIDQIVYLSTTLNTGHVSGLGADTIILPVRARDEESQPTTQESMFNFVRVSDGGPARIEGPRSEVQVLAAMGDEILSDLARKALNWSELSEHGQIQRAIAASVPGYGELESAVAEKREFVVPGRVLHAPVFNRSGGKALFVDHAIPRVEVACDERGQKALRLMTIRSEGQFNTVVYETEDVYRGQERRDIILMNQDDMNRRHLAPDMLVNVRSATGTMRAVRVRPFDIARGCAAMYYPEANVLVGREVDPKSRTPAFKAIDVFVEVT
jgi:molybdopterin-dependent oxidoreductase alpha subunit